MKRLVLAALVAFATSLALADDVPAGYKPASGSPMMVVDENGKARYVKGTDGGALQVAPSTGHWDCSGAVAGTITSTGTTNHGALNTLPAGSYVKGYCTGAAYVGGASTYLNDGGAGNAATCAPRDGGSLFADNCMPYQAYERFYVDMRQTTNNSVGATSAAAATIYCPLQTCSN